MCANWIMDILSTGCHWRAIPKDLPPRSTLFDYLDLLSWNFVDMLQKTDLDGFLLTKPTRIVPP
jgi:transposase